MRHRQHSKSRASAPRSSLLWLTCACCLLALLSGSFGCQRGRSWQSASLVRRSPAESPTSQGGDWTAKAEIVRPPSAAGTTIVSPAAAGAAQDEIVCSPEDAACRVAEGDGAGSDLAPVPSLRGARLLEVGFQAAPDPPSRELPLPQESVSIRPGLVLDEALALALANNPDLRAARGNEWSPAAAIRVAQTYPWNPNIQVHYSPQALSHVERTLANYYILVLQTIELAHQRTFREQFAVATWDQARWTILQMELTTLAGTLRQYMTAVYQQDLLDLAALSVQLNERLLGTIQRRYKAGLSTAAELTLAEVALRQSQRQARLSEANYQTALRTLQQSIGIDIDETLVLGARLTDFAWSPPESEPAGSPPEIGAAAAELAQARPDVLAAAAAVRAAGANERLARASKVPNVQTGPIYTSDDFGNQFLGVRVFVDAPVFNSGEPLARQRHAEWHQRRRALEELRRRAALEAQAALLRFEKARHLAAETQQALPAPQPAALTAIQGQFEAGQATVLDVYAVQNALLQDQRTSLDVLNELAQAAADVVLATALPPQRLLLPARPLDGPPARTPSPIP